MGLLIEYIDNFAIIWHKNLNMNLKLIKLAGFKSFVDPTVISFPGQLSGIIGPNGCGKSNVVDAIRWVIGESSAKQLRGQSMADVIFNGSHQRKPVGKAAVELVFDNSAGRIAGEFSKFSEISIRREVSQEGHSHYYLNGTHCRRRDIVDIFLGTGLGPRSYAIIEQGMISGLIEAKPEEFRVYLEEAAGISKYKERRRETETRINHTQENLDRLNDVIEELGKQLKNLKRQANAAEQYKDLKQQERLLQAEVKALQFRALANLSQQQSHAIEQKKLVLDEKVAELRETETLQTTLRESVTSQQALRDRVQQHYYSMANEITKIEQQINHWHQQTSQWQDELNENQRLYQELQNNLLEYQQQQGEFQHEVEQLQPKLHIAQDHHQEAVQNLKQTEHHSAQQQRYFEQLQSEIAEIVKKIEVAKTKQQHYEQQLASLAARSFTLTQRLTEFNLDPLNDEIESGHLQVSQLETQLFELQQRLIHSGQKLQEQRAGNQQSKQNLSEEQQTLQKLQQRLVSLEAVQQIALGQQDNHINTWLKEHNLQQLPRLAEKLTVKPGWEVAVETVLQGSFDAVCMDESLTALYPALNSLSKGRVTLVSNFSTEKLADTLTSSKLASEPAAEITENSEDSHLPQNLQKMRLSLSDIVVTDYPIDQWLKSIYAVENLEEANHLLPELQTNESVITRQGIWLGKNWLRVTKAQEQQTGVLVREHELRQLRQEVANHIKQCEQQQQVLRKGEESLHLLECERDQLHQQNQQVNQALAEVKSKVSAAKSQLTASQRQHQQLTAEIQQIEEQRTLINQQLLVSKQQLDEDQSQHSLLLVRQQQQLLEKEQDLNQLQMVRASAQEALRRVDELTINLTAAENQLAMVKQRLIRDQRQFEKIDERAQTLKQNLLQNTQPIEDSKLQLQTLLSQRVNVESELQQADHQLTLYQQELAQSNKRWQQLTSLTQNANEELQQLRMQHQETIVRQTTIKEHLIESNRVLENLLKALPVEAEVKDYEQKIQQVNAKITRLGPINLAAIDEFQTVNERKTYLDKQHVDLTEALALLTEAINKIDRETREKFRDTYNRVNKSFQETFPRIFGGGKAELLLTEEDMLNAGVIVKAHPPGKRNASVYSLSGGEKALTAISLVFALFQLNPAPFCILDEVDAPLDDVNVTRFCELVKEMSLHTQFIVISHNKVTMSYAEHLMGVTMQEAGVSRIVSVDMQQALMMVEDH